MKKLVWLASLLLPFAVAVDALADSSPVTPASVTATLTAGQTALVTTQVVTPTIPANPDLVFLADTTGSMSGAIGNVRDNANSIMDTIGAANPSAQFGVAEYKDEGDSPLYAVDQNLTADKDAVATGIGNWSADGGGDYPEGQINALYHLASDISWRSDSNRIIAWFGDAPGHDPSNGVTLDQAIAALTAAHIRVIAITVGEGDAARSAGKAPIAATAVQPVGDGLDDYGQATAIVNATGGVLMSTGGDVAKAILDGLKALDTTVVPVFSGDSHLGMTFDPPTQTVASGTTVTIKETLKVTADAPAGATLKGTVSYKLNGAVGTGYTQSITVNTPKGAVLAATAGPGGPLPIGLLALTLLVAGAALYGLQRVRPRVDAG